jgi:hypothetical protein
MGMKGVIIVNPSTGINEAVAGAKITLSPNPTNDIVKIKTEAELVGVAYSVTDNTGKQIASGLLDPNETLIDLSRYSAGYYFVQIGDDKKQTFKIVRK